MGVAGTLVGFEIFFNAIPGAKSKASRNRADLVVSDLPFVLRDFAFVVDAHTAVGQIVRAARGADKKLIADVSVFDVFEGEAIGEGRKSVAIAARLEPTKRTLTDAEIDAVAAKIVAAVESATGAVLRR